MFFCLKRSRGGIDREIKMYITEHDSCRRGCVSADLSYAAAPHKDLRTTPRRHLGLAKCDLVRGLSHRALDVVQGTIPHGVALDAEDPALPL